MKIKSLTVGFEDGSYFEVGKSGITSIVNSGLEFESSVHSQYDVYRNEKLHAVIENLPVEVFYFDEEVSRG
jgi:hypothetical protein